MEQAYTNKKSILKRYFHSCFSYLKIMLNCIFLCCIFHSGLSAQAWFKEFSFTGTDHSIYEVIKFNDQSFGLLFKEDNTDIFIGVDNISGNTTTVQTWGKSTEDVIGGDSGVIKVGLNQDSLQAVNLIKTANVTFVQWLKNFPPPSEFQFYDTPVSIIQLSGGDYIILATIKANAPFATGNLLSRINSNGDMVWQKDISGVGRASIPFDIYASTDNNFFIHSLAALGSSNAGHYIHKVDAQGNVLWTKGPEQDPNPPGTIFYSYSHLIPTPDGGLLFRETVGLSVKRDKKLNVNGSIAWTKSNSLGRLIQLVDDKLVTYETIQNFNESSYELRIGEINGNGETIIDQSILSTINDPIKLITKFILKNNDGSYTLIGNSSNNLNALPKPDKLFALRTTVSSSVPSCLGVVIEGEDDQITITGITAPIEIVEVYDQNWQQVFRCQGTDCGTEQTINNLNAGRYYVKIQFFDANWQSICRLDNVKVEVTEGGVSSCDDAIIESGDGEIKIFGLTAPIEIVEVYNQNWQQVFRCQGTNCGAEQIINGLSDGRHYVKVQFYNENWQWICGLGTVEVDVGSGTDCNNPDYLAMAVFANTLTDQSNTINWSPLDCDICNWTGITCNPAGRVEKIELTGLPLRGTMPSEIGQLAALKVLVIESVVDLNGTIPTEIGNLTNLEILTIVNQLEAPVGLEGGIPTSITQLTRLKSLIIQGNVFFNEPIPANIGNLTNLETLDLSYNRMPETIPTSIGNLTRLHTLKLEHNNLTGDIPKELGSLRNLKKLILGERQPTGSFFLYGLNRLTGSIPSELGNLTELEELDFTYNPLSGQIPSSLGNLTKIKRANFQAFDFVRPTGRRDLGKLEGCFPRELSVWCDNGATVSFEGHLNLPYPTTKFPMFCDNMVNNPTAPDICLSAGNCERVNIIGGVGKFTISGLNAPNVIVDVFDSNWNGVFRCVGQEFSETIEITSLSIGNYRVNIQFFAADWNPICRRENELVEVGSNGTPSCDDIIVSDDNGTIDIAGLTAPIEIVRIFDLDNGWQQVFECNNDCEDSQNVSGLTSQNYLVKVQMYTNNWGWICERNIEFSFGGSGSRAALAQMIRANKLLAVSPNPAQQEIYLNTKNLNGKVGTIRIYNIYGILIEVFDNQEFNTFYKRFDVSSYENGLYFLNVKMKDLPMVTQRFIVESLR